MMPEGWTCPDWFIAQHAARINFIPFWVQVGLPAPSSPDDPLTAIYANVAADYDYAMKMAEFDRYHANKNANH